MVKSMRRFHLASGIEDRLLRRTRFAAAALIVVAIGGIAFAQGVVDPTAVKSEDGKYFDKEGTPTFKVAADGTVDWYTY